MPQVRRDVPLSFGNPKKTFNGFVLVNTENGDMEWYSNSFPGTPTFQSNASNGFKWEPNSDSSINNLAGTFGNKQKEDFAEDMEVQLSDPNSQLINDFNNIRVQQIEDNGSQEEREDLLYNDEDGDRVPNAPTTFGDLENLDVSGSDTFFQDTNYSGLRYPNDIDLNTQDCISITILSYGKKTFKLQR